VLNTMKLLRTTATALVACAGLTLTALSPLANAESAPGAISPSLYAYPTHYDPEGVPEYGLFGHGQWQVAGVVNAGEPSLRVVYDQTVPGAYQSAIQTVYAMQADFPGVPQPGVTTGLREIGYTAHYDGVQIQVYSNVPQVSVAAATAFAQMGIPLIPMS